MKTPILSIPVANHRWLMLPVLILLGALAIAAAEPKADPAAGDEILSAILAKAKTSPNDYRIMMRLAARCAVLGRVANAEQAYKRASELNTSSLEPYHGLCLLYFANKRYADALRTANAWVAKDPHSYYGRLCLADAISLNGETKKSLSVLLDLNRNFPSDTTVLAGLKARYDFLGMTKESEAAAKMIAEVEKSAVADGLVAAGSSTDTQATQQR